MNKYTNPQYQIEMHNRQLEAFRKLTNTNEPQTAAFQAAVDNVWFEQTWTAGQQKSEWFSRSGNTRDERIDYIVSLEQQMKWALGTNGRGLNYRLLS